MREVKLAEELPTELEELRSHVAGAQEEHVTEAGKLVAVIPCSEIAEKKLPYVCLGCFIHTYSNNMINRFQVQ
jgi:hypothetical protein